jgi:hypothetical protein
VERKVSGVFGNVGRAIQQLLFGWITIQIVDLIEAFSTGNTKKLQEIAGNILKTLAIVVAANGVLSIIKLGISKVVGLVVNLAARVSGFVIKGLFLKPFEILVNAIKNAWKRVVSAGPSRVPTPAPGAPGSPGGPKGPKGKGPGIFGAAWAAVESFMNFKNGEYIDAVMPIVAAFGPGKFVKGLFAAGYAADQIAEIFGTNIFGKDPNKKEEAQKAFDEEKKGSSSPAQTSSVAQAQTPMMGGEKKDDKGKGVEANVGSLKGSDVKEVSSTGVSVAPGTEGSATSVTPQTPMTPSAGDLSLGSTAATPNVTPAGATTTPATTTSPEQTPANITPVQNQSANTKMESLGPEPKPQTTVIAQTPTPIRTQTPSMGSGASTDVPKIKSSNPENFYALYSQFNYNVVM